MKKISSKKLLHTKWTAVKPQNKEKHFMITEVKYDEEGNVIHCLLEAIMTKRERDIDWKTLENTEQWIQGWK